MWLTTKQFRSKYNITPQHLYALKKAGKIETKPSVGSKYLIKDSIQDKSVCIYARVSTPKQKNDLENQIDFIKKYCISNGYNPEFVFSDIASGMNENRKGLNEMISNIIDGKISKVYISHKDRLTRFGYRYLENLFNKFGTEIVVINLEDEKNFQEELAEDLIAIIHHFSMKFYGKRKNKMKEIEGVCKTLNEIEDK